MPVSMYASPTAQSLVSMLSWLGCFSDNADHVLGRIESSMRNLSAETALFLGTRFPHMHRERCHHHHHHRHLMCPRPVRTRAARVCHGPPHVGAIYSR